MYFFKSTVMLEKTSLVVRSLGAELTGSDRFERPRDRVINVSILPGHLYDKPSEWRGEKFDGSLAPSLN